MLGTSVFEHDLFPKHEEFSMHPILAAAIANPRIARPYGSERGDWGFESGLSGVDNFVKGNNLGVSPAEEMRMTRSIASGRAKAIVGGFLN
jgi:hypothetical protein